MFAKKLRKLREQANLNQEELAKILSVSPSTIGMYEQGRRQPDHEKLKQIADYFNVPLDYLLGRTDDPTPYLISVSQGTEKLREPGHDDPEGSKNLPLGEVRKIPIYSLKPKNRKELFAPDNIIGWEPVPADTLAQFAIKIDDESMSGSRINKGDRAIIREQQTFVDGQTVLVRITDGSFIIRKANRTNNGDIILSPDNQNYRLQVFKQEELRIIGIVIQVNFDYI
jgi:transcriptional regulator with XRE-family HTH domain